MFPKSAILGSLKLEKKALLPPFLKLLLRSRLLFSIILLRTINKEISKKFYPQVKPTINCL